jgi:beta-lactamase regulating signal transducer with metallopeptidase domain
VLAHELCHYRHRDHIWALLRGLCLVLYWWNPLVWLAAVFSRIDGELACDEGAVSRLGDTERAAYGHTLLDLAVLKQGPESLLRTATSIGAGKREMKSRIYALTKKRLPPKPNSFLTRSDFQIKKTAIRVSFQADKNSVLQLSGRCVCTRR